MSRFATLNTRRPAVSGQLDNTAGRVRRISVLESSGTAAASFELWDGSSAAGKLLDVVALSPGQSTRDRYEGVEYVYETGLFINVLAGTFYGTIVVEHSDDWGHEGMPVVLVNPDVLSIDVNPGS
jgi:hypothetical protein